MRCAFIAAFLLCAAVARQLGATAQAPDVLRVGDQTYYLQTNPLEAFLEGHPGALPEPEVVSSGNWRGYIASWALRDGALLLTDVTVATRGAMDPKAPEQNARRSVLRDLFPNGRPQEATWFTGHLVVPTGELVRYVHMGYASTYSSYMIVTVVEGQVESTADVNLEGFEAFRARQFEAFKKTPEYARAVAATKRNEPSMSDAEIEKFLFEYETPVFLPRVFR